MTAKIVRAKPGSSKHRAIDLDDVILDFVGGILRWVKTEYDVDIPESEITNFNLRPTLDPIIGKSWWTALRERDWLWPNFDAVPGAIGALEKMRNQGDYLEIVTSKPQWAEYATWKWLGKWRPAVNRVTIVGPDDSKVDFTNATLLIDDKMENVKEFVAAGRQAILFDRPHNQTASIPGVSRAHNWAEVLEILKQMEA
jgi:5'(3')-deoxyribonucleotidase